MALRDIFLRAAPEPEPEAPPNLDKDPRGTSGRGHTAGFIELEELNPDLQHPEGARVYDKMYRGDGDVRQAVSLVCNPVTGGTWGVEADGGEDATEEAESHAEFLREVFFNQEEWNLIDHLIEFLPVLARTGFVPGELCFKSFEWKGEAKVCIDTIQMRLPRTIVQWEQDRKGRLTRIKQQLPSSQAAVVASEDEIVETAQDDPSEIWLNKDEIVYYRIGKEGDNWEGVSLLRPAYKHWWYKDTIEKIDAIAQEREALGVPICYPPLGATDDQLDAMEEILQNMRTNEEGYIIAPGPKAGSGMAPEGQGWLIEVIGYDRTGSGRDPMPSLEYHTQKIAAAFISEFMRLGHGQSGARATAQVQADPFLMAIEAFVGMIETVVNDLARRVLRYNFAGIKRFPKVKMSLVDATSLQQLADFIQKLTSVGALFPDQKLEDFLRARADLPPADPSAVKKRKAEDDKLRREVVTPPAADPFGANDKPGKPHGSKPAPGSNPGGTGGKNRGKKDGIRADAILLDGTTLRDYEEYEPAEDDRYRWRKLNWYELVVDLNDFEDRLDDQSRMFESFGRDHVIEMARAMADEVTPLGYGGTAQAMAKTLIEVLEQGYTYGAESVVREIHAQRMPVEDESIMQFTTLDRGARDRKGALAERAAIAADQIELAMRHAMLGADLTHGNRALAQAAGEKAGLAALKRAGHQHGVAAILHGRHDQGHMLAEDDNGLDIVGVRYSAILDRGTCSECLEADDGVLRPLNDPVRLDRQPPNHHCHSTASGFNMCRCFEVFEILPPNADPKLNETSALPSFVREVAAALMDRGMEPARAVATAQALARSFCRTGVLAWPGLAHLAVSRTAACEAAGWKP